MRGNGERANIGSIERPYMLLPLIGQQITGIVSRFYSKTARYGRGVKSTMLARVEIDNEAKKKKIEEEKDNWR